MEVDEGGLEDIVDVFKNSDSSWYGKVKKVSYYPLAILYGGVLRRKYQKRFAEKIGWREKNLTISNAAFGMVTSALFYVVGEKVGSLGNLEYIQNLNNVAVSFVADSLGITAKTLLYSHALFDGVQSLYRIVHAQITKESIASFSLTGAAGNAAYALFHLKKK